MAMGVSVTDLMKVVSDVATHKTELTQTGQGQVNLGQHFEVLDQAVHSLVSVRTASISSNGFLLLPDRQNPAREVGALCFRPRQLWHHFQQYLGRGKPLPLEDVIFLLATLTLGTEALCPVHEFTRT